LCASESLGAFAPDQYSFLGTIAVKDTGTVRWFSGRFNRYINIYRKKAVARFYLKRSTFSVEYKDKKPII
jgi:hypothetical protein